MKNMGCYKGWWSIGYKSFSTFFVSLLLSLLFFFWRWKKCKI